MPTYTTSGTTDFNPDIIDIIEEAYERCGLEMRSPTSIRTARRSLNIMMKEWQNRGINLWTFEEVKVPTVISQASYAVEADTIDVLEHVLRVNDGLSNQIDYTLDRISHTRYMAIPNKTYEGQPRQVYYDRQKTGNIYLWPVPDLNTYKIVYTKIRSIEDTGHDSTLNMDIPDRFIPALTAGLAFHLAVKRPEAADRIEALKAMYDEQFEYAAAEDREKVPLRLKPMRYDR